MLIVSQKDTKNIKQQGFEHCSVGLPKISTGCEFSFFLKISGQHPISTLNKKKQFFYPNEMAFQ